MSSSSSSSAKSLTEVLGTGELRSWFPHSASRAPFWMKHFQSQKWKPEESLLSMKCRLTGKKKYKNPRHFEFSLPWSIPANLIERHISMQILTQRLRTASWNLGLFFSLLTCLKSPYLGPGTSSTTFIPPKSPAKPYLFQVKYFWSIQL